VTNIEELRLSAASDVAFANGLVAGSSNGYFVVRDSSGDDKVNASFVVSTPIAFFSNGGNDTFTGGGGNDTFLFSAADLTAADTVVGRAGSNKLILSTAGTVSAASLVNVSEIDALVLSSAGNNVTLTDALAAGSSVGYFSVVGGAGNDTVDASFVINTPVAFVSNGGNDNFTGGNRDDSFSFAAADLTSADTVAGGGGADKLVLTTAGTVSAANLAGVSGLEALVLDSGGNNVTLTDGMVAAPSTGFFAVFDGAGADTVDASGITNNTAIAFFSSGGADTFKGGNGNDAFAFAVADLTSADTVVGGAGADKLTLTTAGTVSAASLANVSGLEALALSSGGNNVTLTNGMVAGPSTGFFAVFDGAGTDTVDASGVTNNTAIAFFGSGGADTFTGGNGNDSFSFAVADLTSADTVVGGAGVDLLRFDSGGTVLTSAFTNVSGLEALALNNAGNNVTLTNALVAGTSVGFFSVFDGAGNDTVDASGITNNTAIGFSGSGGTDTFTGGNGNDTFWFAAADLTSADTVAGGTGSDKLILSTSGTVAAAAFTNVSGLEALTLGAGGNNVTLTNNAVAGTAVGFFSVLSGGGADTVDASLATTTPIAFFSGGGADNFSGGGGNDAFYIPSSAFAGINGNGGLDRIVLATPGQSFDLTANNAKITNTEIVSLSGSAAASLTLAATDIPIVNATTNLLYVVGEADDSVTAGAGWTVVTVNFVNNVVAPGHTFTQYHSAAANSDLFIDTAITPSITAAPTAPTDTNAAANSVFETAAHTGDLAGITASSFGGTGATVTYSITVDGSGGGFTIGSASGIVSVADGALVDYEGTAPGHTYSITVTATTSGGATSQVFSIAVADVNDAPTLSATPLDPGFTEGGAAVDLFSGPAASAIEAGQNLNTLVITVSNVAGTGATESLFIDGSTVALNTHSQSTLTNSMTANVSLSGPGGTATVTISKVGGVSSTIVQNIVDGLAYGNTSNSPGAATRVVSITSVSDTGGTANGGIDTTALTLHSDVAVTPVNSAPTVVFGAVNGFTENGTPTSASSVAVTIAPSLTVSDSDSTNLTQATFVLNNLKPSDALSVSGFAGTSGDIGGVGGIHFDITSTATTETVTFTGTHTITDYNAALHLVQFNNTSDNPDTTARSYTVTAVDDGSGTNTGSASTTETVTAVNDGPINNGVPASFTVESGFSHAITGLSITDLDTGSANDITTTLTSVGTAFVTIGAVGGGAVITNNGTNAVTLTGTTTAINLSLGGSVVYTAADNVNNSPTTTLTIATDDHGHTGTPGGIIDTDVISVGVTPQVWFIDQAQVISDGTAPRGSQANPFADITEFNGSSGPGNNDYVYLKAGTYTGPGINLKDGQTLLGDDQALSVVDPFGGPNIVIETASGARPTIHVTTAGDQGIDVASGNTIRGVNIQTDAGNSGLDDGSGANNVGTLTVSDMAISGVGKAIDLDGSGTLAVTLASISSTGATADGIDLTGMGGSLTVSGGTTVSNAGTTGIHVQNSTAGANFNFGNTNVAGAAGTGVDLASNVGNITFADLDINGDVGARSLLAVGNTGTLTSTSGTIVQDGGGGGFAISGATTLNMALDSLSVSNTGSTGADISGVGGSLTVGTTTITSNTLVGVQVRSTVAGSTMDFGNTSVTGSHTAAAVRLGVTAGVDGNAGNIVFDDLDIANSGNPGVFATGNTGTTTISAGTISTGAGNAINLTSNTGGTFNLGGGTGDVDITTTSGTGFNATGGATINVTGASNTIQTATGQVLNWSGVGIGASNATFASLQSTGTVANTAVALNNVDGNTFNGGAVTVAGTSGATSDGIRIDGGSSSAFNFSSATISNTGDDGIDLNGANGAVTFTTVNINGDAGAGIETTGNTNAIAINGGTIGNTNDPAGIGVDVNNGTGNINVDATINKTTAGHVVEVSGRTAGTVDFNGNITSNTAGGGIDLTSNTGGTTRFDGGMTLSTGANPAFNSSGGSTGATLVVTDPAGATNNTLTTTTGTALNVVDTTIGAEHLTFQSISTNGGANGIVLNNTGTSGHLTVTGTGTTDGTGGTINNTTGDSISLTSTQDVSLSNMNITNSQGRGINGTSVNGVVLENLNISESGNSTAGNGEGNIYFSELTGNASHVTTFNNLVVSNAFVHNVFINNTAGLLTNLVVTNSTFSNDGASTVAGSAFVINLASAGLAGSPTATVHATHNTFSGNLSAPATFTATGFQGSVDDGTLNVHLGDGTAGGLNTFDTNNSGITLSSSNAGNLNFDVNDNTVTHNRAVGVAINHFGTGTVTGFFRNNVIGTQNQAGSGAQIGNGLDIHDEGTAGPVTLSVTNNVIQSVGGGGLGFEGVDIQQLNGAQNSSGVLNITFTGNTIRDIIDDRGLFINEGNIAGGGKINALVSGNTFSNANGNGATTTARVGGAPGGTNAVNVTQANAATLASDNGLTASGAPGNTMRVDTNVVFSQPAPVLPPATPQMALHGQGPGSSQTLTMSELTPLLAIAIQHWADAGASAAQIAALETAAAHVQIADLANSGFLANTDDHGITIDTNAAGWGWFIDPTPGDNNEFHATATANELAANGGDAAGHMDLLTVVEHELGHIIGLGDSDSTGVMNVNLDVGERRMPDVIDVAQASEADIPQISQAPAGTPVVAGNAANNTIDAGHGGGLLFGGAGADNFVFGPGIQLNAPTPAQVTHVADYSAAQGDTFDFSALTSAFHNSSVSDSLVVRAVEDASGKFAMLQVDHIDPMGLPSAPNWVNVAQLDGAHAGDAVNILIDSNHSVHLAQIHVDLLV
jgi:Ca2+-binding RTX toxin-like protein